MPSASAKIEKVASAEATDAVKQIVNMFEKRVRNLEKRKMKLDNYRSDVQKGKELNEDQKMAVSKYEQVEANLEFAKEFSKSMGVIVVECARAQKKHAKKEQVERQQNEIQRLQEAFVFRHLLGSFQSEDVRADFLSGENGAVQITSEQLSQIDQFYKLTGFNIPDDRDILDNHYHHLAENLIFLVEGKNKDIAGTTYKVLKELLNSIKESGYFSRPAEPLEDDGTSSEDLPEEESANEKAEQSDEYSAPQEIEQIQESTEDQFEAIVETGNDSVPEELTPEILHNGQNGPLEVLESEATFNFLQESQIDLDAPHMDPAVVAVHQIAPATAYIDTYPDKVNGRDPTPPPPPPQNPLPPSTMAAPPPDTFDPSHPIPTQTFTNQSFAVMQNIMVPQGFVPVAVPHHRVPMAVVSPSAVPPPQAEMQLVTDVAVEKEEVDVARTNGEQNGPDADLGEHPGDRGRDGNGYPQFRGGYRGRGRGRSNNGYFRGRSNYHNNRGGYQNHYQDRNGYGNGNFRRGSNRSGPRGGGGPYRARGNYKPQGYNNYNNNHHQQQQSPPQQNQQQAQE